VSLSLQRAVKRKDFHHGENRGAQKKLNVTPPGVVQRVGMLRLLSMTELFILAPTAQHYRALFSGLRLIL
jgi:hypothetical protein